MSITDLLPWNRKKKKAKVPVKVEKQPARTLERDMARRSDALTRWLGLAPFGLFGSQWNIFGPRMDMVESSDGFKITIEVPGMGRDDIDVTLSQDRLLIRGRKREEKERRGRNTYYARSTQRAFRRSIQLPCQIDADDAEAVLRRGILTISLPKVGDARGRKQISIGSG